MELAELEAELAALGEAWLERHAAGRDCTQIERAIDQATTEFKSAERRQRREAERGTLRACTS